MIFVMGVTMLKMDRAKAKWRVKLQRAFEGQREYSPRAFLTTLYILNIFTDVDAGAKSGKWVLFILPLITVLREGMYPKPSTYMRRQNSINRPSALHRNGSCSVRGRCLSWPTRYIHPHCCYRWAHLWTCLWFLDLHLCQPN